MNKHLHLLATPHLLARQFPTFPSFNPGCLYATVLYLFGSLPLFGSLSLFGSLNSRFVFTL